MGVRLRWGARLILVVSLMGWALPAAGQPATCDGLSPTHGEGTSGDDVLVGTPRGDRFYGGEGDDLICGGGGNDWISPGPGADRVDGGGGQDVVLLSSDQRLVVDLPAGTVTGAGGDRLDSVEGVDAGCSPHGDTLIGDDADNFLLGGAGPDTITGGDGADRLYGEEVSYNDVPPCNDWEGDGDSIDGGPGDDVLFGETGSDSLEGAGGFDALHGGGGGSDDCRNGEIYVSCDTEDPPAPPPVCADGVDNDGDGRIDYDRAHPEFDGGCAAPRNPTEDSYQDPSCYDGVDSDADGLFDFPEDWGCASYEDNDEYVCPPPGGCTPEVRVTIEFSGRTGRFFGEVQVPDPCKPRTVKLYLRTEERRYEFVEQVRSRADGSWRSSPVPASDDRYQAWVKQVLREIETGDVVRCKADSSKWVSASS